MMNEKIDLIETISLAENIKNFREYNNLSQRELARRTKINNSLISRIENGEIKKPKYEVLKKISNEFDLNICQLLTIAGYTEEEQMDLGLITETIGVKGVFKLEKYIILSNGSRIVDLIKVLEDYKKNKLTVAEVFGLFMCRTGIDMTKYVPIEKREKYGLDNMIESHKKNEN